MIRLPYPCLQASKCCVKKVAVASKKEGDGSGKGFGEGRRESYNIRSRQSHAVCSTCYLQVEGLATVKWNKATELKFQCTRMHGFKPNGAIVMKSSERACDDYHHVK